MSAEVSRFCEPVSLSGPSARVIDVLQGVIKPVYSNRRQLGMKSLDDGLGQQGLYTRRPRVRLPPRDREAAAVPGVNNCEIAPA
jgi:hypothetical protein